MAITRRDFLDGVALSVVAGLTPMELLAQAQAGSDYPPGLTGWRGGTPLAYDIAHGVRDGRRYEIDQLPVEETWDLVVIGAGISGLSAAQFYRQRYPRARVLILDNHDDFGGHACRNEFTVDGRLLVGYGGSESIQSPAYEWSEVASGLLAGIGVQVDRFETAFDRQLYPGLGLSRGVFFAREAFGSDKLVTGDPLRMVADDVPADGLNARTWAQFIGDFPLAAEQQAKLLALFTEQRDVLAGMTVAQKEAVLATTSYRDFIMNYWGLDAAAANTFQGRSHDFFAVGIDVLPAFDAMETGYPGFTGLGLEQDAEAAAELDDPYIHHFPDGNASLARLLVRKLIPAVAPGSSMDDIVTARFDYSRLDASAAPVRLRLEATAVALHNRQDAVDIGYVRAGQLHRVQAQQAIYAGYGMMLPYICPEVGETQKAALAAGVKAPLVYVNVAVRNWQPWVRQGVHEITNPMGFFSRIKLDYPVSLGDYRFPSNPDEPMLLHLVHVPALPAGSGVDQRTGWRVARNLLYTTTFDSFEQRVRDELTRMLGAGGFDADRDISAITVNRWGHGYAYGANSLFDEEQDPAVNVVGQQRLGRIGIAGSDAAWSAYAHSAIDEAWRAVTEITG